MSDIVTQEKEIPLQEVTIDRRQVMGVYDHVAEKCHALRSVAATSINLLTKASLFGGLIGTGAGILLGAAPGMIIMAAAVALGGYMLSGAAERMADRAETSKNRFQDLLERRAQEAAKQLDKGTER